MDTELGKALQAQRGLVSRDQVGQPKNIDFGYRLKREALCFRPDMKSELFDSGLV